MHKLVCDPGLLPSSRKCQVGLLCDLEGVAACPMHMMCLQSCLNGHVALIRRYPGEDMRREGME
jgi:hypothetical protein